jgi:Arc/MetJ-type ribon-helix-helix transcriptional regulator
VERKLKRTRNIRIPDNWQEEIDDALQAPDAVTSASGFIRAAIREKLDGVQSAKQMLEIEERQAATLLKLVASIDRLERAMQTQIAFQDAMCKVVLTHLPQPANMQAARELGQERYKKLVDYVAHEMAANGYGNANGHA